MKLKPVVFSLVLIIRVKLLNRAVVGTSLEAVGGVNLHRYIGQDTVEKLLKLDEFHYSKAVTPYGCG